MLPEVAKRDARGAAARAAGSSFSNSPQSHRLPTGTPACAAVASRRLRYQSWDSVTRLRTRRKELSMSDTSTTSVPGRRGDELLSALAERIGARLGAATVFGAAVERDGVTVVPVAVARFGFGAGSGSHPSKRQQGEGGGGGGIVAPTGYIELKDGRSRFVPVVHPARMLALVLGAVIAALAIIRPKPGRPNARKLPWS
jgi:uncharacterized spore protein YtfJ